MFPIFFENSRIPVWLSKLSPIEIGAISLGLLVFSRGTINERTRRHETIHYMQWLELGFLGFLILYPSFWLLNLLRGMDGATAYLEIPFEREAYSNDADPSYLSSRRGYAWIKHLKYPSP